MGTPYYMSPEQCRASRNVDGRADIWSLGIILYELMTGRVPFEGQSTYAIFHWICRATPRPPFEIRQEIPADLSALVLKCLEKNPDARYQDVSELMTRCARSLPFL